MLVLAVVCGGLAWQSGDLGAALVLGLVYLAGTVILE